MTNTVNTPTAWLYLNSACKFGFNMAPAGPPRLVHGSGLVEVHVLDPEGAVRVTVLAQRTSSLGRVFTIETGSVEVTNLTVPQFEGLLVGLLQTVDPV